MLDDIFLYFLHFKCIKQPKRLSVFSQYLLSALICLSNLLHCKHLGPRSYCSFRSSLIRVHSVCFHDKIILQCFCIGQNNQSIFSGQNISRIRAKYQEIRKDNSPTHAVKTFSLHIPVSRHFIRGSDKEGVKNRSHWNVHTTLITPVQLAKNFPLAIVLFGHVISEISKRIDKSMI